MTLAPPLPAGVDHLVYGVTNLETGMDEMGRLLGVRPVPGGRHPDFGTHNALLGLGPVTYLEIIAPDPESLQPGRGTLFGVDTLERPRLVTWALRREALEQWAVDTASQELGLGTVQSGSRKTPEGRVLSWKLTDPYAMPMDGTLPFLIAWGETPHPADDIPRGGELVGSRLEHPNAGGLRRSLLTLGVEMRVTEAPLPRIVATIRTPGGEVEVQ